MRKIILFILNSILVASCTKATTEGGGGLPPQNLFLDNQTFDNGADPALNGWSYAHSDIDSTAHFSADIPPGSKGKWSLSLNPGWLPSTEYVYRDFTNLSNGIYKLTLWGKIVGNSGRGEILISKNPLQPWNPSVSTQISDTVWKQISLLDTLTLSVQDTIHIILTGGSTEIATWSVLYNNITFERLP